MNYQFTTNEEACQNCSKYQQHYVLVKGYGFIATCSGTCLRTRGKVVDPRKACKYIERRTNHETL